MRVSKGAVIGLIGLAGMGMVGSLWFRKGQQEPAPPIRFEEPQSALATWPWPGAVQDTPHPGVTHWYLPPSQEATALDLLEFDFAANPHLRLEIYDQDEDDDTPGDNQSHYWEAGVAAITRHLNTTRPGKIVAAWNGLFFSYDQKGGERIAEHLSPLVLRGKLFYHFGNHRWTFGVKYSQGKPTFKTFHLPERATLEREFDFAAGAAQCLIREGVPLKLQPFPQLIPAQWAVGNRRSIVSPDFPNAPEGGTLMYFYVRDTNR